MLSLLYWKSKKSIYNDRNNSWVFHYKFCKSYFNVGLINCELLLKPLHWILNKICANKNKLKKNSCGAVAVYPFIQSRSNYISWSLYIIDDMYML